MIFFDYSTFANPQRLTVGDRDNPTMIGNIQFPHQVKVRGLIGKVNIVIPPPPSPLHTK
jgi:hypothetical protein